MRKINLLSTFALGLLGLVFFQPAASAQPGTPAYLQALSDLRTARAWIQMEQRPFVAEQRGHAIDEINHAIDEIKKNARHMGKDTDYTPPPQSGGDPGAVWHSALKLLKEAHNDVAQGQDYPDDVGRQVRSLQHIDVAKEAVEHAIAKLGGR